jgi:hypothetical protein
VKEFYAYMNLFEDLVVSRGVDLGILGALSKVSVRSGALSGQRFGRVMGKECNSDKLFAIDYYGLIKKSRGFFALASGVSPGQQVKSIEVPLVYFAAIRIEQIAQIWPDLVSGFPRFKKLVLDSRGFNHSYKV